LETPVFDAKTFFSKKIPNFGNQTIPKLAKMKNSEFSVFRRALQSTIHLGESAPKAEKIF